jgi:IclR family pca regulon transcriptional regulator
MNKLKTASPKAKSKSGSDAPVSHSPLPVDPDMAEDKNYIAALARGLSVIRAFAYQRDQLTLAEISRLVDLPRATVRRCLITLNALNYVESDGKYFSLTPKVLTLSQAYFSSSPLPHIARPYIEQVSNAVGESCSVSVLASDEVIYIARSARKRSASIQREVGVNLPAYCTSMGRVLLASLAPADLDTYFRRVTLRKFNAKTVTDEAELRAILDQIRHDDYAIIDGELEPNLRAIAVPVRNMSGRTVAACHISSDAGRVTTEKMQTAYLPPLRDAVASIRRALVG